jgi:hypothetical protein
MTAAALEHNDIPRDVRNALFVDTLELFQLVKLPCNFQPQGLAVPTPSISPGDVETMEAIEPKKPELDEELLAATDWSYGLFLHV